MRMQGPGESLCSFWGLFLSAGPGASPWTRRAAAEISPFAAGGDRCAYWAGTALALQHQFNAVRIVRSAALIEVAGLLKLGADPAKGLSLSRGTLGLRRLPIA